MFGLTSVWNWKVICVPWCMWFLRQMKPNKVLWKKRCLSLPEQCTNEFKSKIFKYYLLLFGLQIHQLGYNNIFSITTTYDVMYVSSTRHNWMFFRLPLVKVVRDCSQVRHTLLSLAACETRKTSPALRADTLKTWDKAASENKTGTQPVNAPKLPH